jgi:hypothetical protein
MAEVDAGSRSHQHSNAALEHARTLIVAVCAGAVFGRLRRSRSALARFPWPRPRTFEWCAPKIQAAFDAIIAVGVASPAARGTQIRLRSYAGRALHSRRDSRSRRLRPSSAPRRGHPSLNRPDPCPLDPCRLDLRRLGLRRPTTSPRAKNPPDPCRSTMTRPPKFHLYQRFHQTTYPRSTLRPSNPRPGCPPAAARCRSCRLRR